MDAIMGFFSAHPEIVTALKIFSIVVIAYLLIKQFIKTLLVVVAIVIVIGGYYYFQAPHKVTEKVEKMISAVKTGSERLLRKGKGFYNDSKELIDETKEMPGEFNRLLKGTEEKEKEKEKK